MTRDEEIQAMTPIRIGVMCRNVTCTAPPFDDGLAAPPEPVIAMCYMQIGLAELPEEFAGGAYDPPAEVAGFQIKDKEGANFLSFIHVN